MPGLEDLGQYIAESPLMQQSLAGLANESPEVGLKRAYLAQSIRASQEEAQAQQQRDKALRDKMATLRGNITPEVALEIMKYDPKLGLDLLEQIRKAQQPDMSYQFNPVTGDLVGIDKKTGAASTIQPSGGDIVSSGASAPVGGEASASELTIPPEIAKNPKARQQYLEQQAKLAAENESTAQLKSKATSSLDQSLTELEGLVDGLNAMGGMVNENQSLNKNVATTLKATDIGQKLTRATGNKEQAVRDEIGMLVPALMQDIKKATGMTASEINSIPEMELLRRSVGGDTSIPYSAVKNNIQRIRQKYVSGGKIPTTPTRDDAGAELRRRGLMK